jgi:hypothetical protein
MCMRRCGTRVFPRRVLQTFSHALLSNLFDGMALRRATHPESCVPAWWWNHTLCECRELMCVPNYTMYMSACVCQCCL